MLRTTQYSEVTRIDSARTIAGRGYYWSTAYHVDGLLVDTGCAHSADEMARLMRSQKLDVIINTHTHEDHIGANGVLQDQNDGVRIYVHPSALPVLKNPREKQPLQLYRRVFWGWPTPSVGTGVQDGELIEIGDHCYQVIYTPGHSPDHICVYEPECGWLFTGDLFVGGKDRALRAEYDIWQIISSLKRISALPLRKLFPGSARVRENPRQELLDKIDYLEETGERVLGLHKEGWGINAITRHLFGGPMMIEIMTLGDFTRRGLVESYLRMRRD